MSNSIVHQTSDSKSDTSFAVRIGTSFGSYHPLVYDRMGPEVISLSNDSDSERASRNSLEKKPLHPTHLKPFYEIATKNEIKLKYTCLLQF